MAHTIGIQIEVPLQEDPQQWEDLQPWLQAHLPALQGCFPTDLALLRLWERLRLN